MTQDPLRKDIALGFLDMTAFWVFLYAAAQRLNLGRHRQTLFPVWDIYHFCSTWGMEIPTRIKAKGSPQGSSSIAQHPSRAVFCRFCNSSSLLLPPWNETKGLSIPWMEQEPSPRDPLSLWVQSTFPTCLHHCSMTAFPLYSLHAESRGGLQLGVLDEAFSSFQLTFQCRLYWIDAASHVVGKFWLPYTPHRRNPTASVRSWKGGGLWLWKAVLIRSSFMHSPACLFPSHLFPTSICRGSKGTSILPMSDKMRKTHFSLPMGPLYPIPPHSDIFHHTNV